MIAALAGLLFCQLLGEVLVRALGLPVPGPVAGLGLMFVFLVVHGRRARSQETRSQETRSQETQSQETRSQETQSQDGAQDKRAIPADLARVADAFLDNLSLLFIPAAVGVVQYLGLLKQFAWPIALTVVVSTSAALAVTALVFRLVARLQKGRPATAEEPQP